MIGLIFGDTDFPKEILKTIKKNKIKYLIIDLSKSKKFKKDKKSFAVSMGQFGKIINILKENNCKKVLFAGKVNKPKFSKLKLDLKGIYYIPRIIKASKLGDAAILREIIKILAQNKIKTENSLTFNPKLSLKKGNYSKIELFLDSVEASSMDIQIPGDKIMIQENIEILPEDITKFVHYMKFVSLGEGNFYDFVAIADKTFSKKELDKLPECYENSHCGDNWECTLDRVCVFQEPEIG